MFFLLFFVELVSGYLFYFSLLFLRIALQKYSFFYYLPPFLHKKIKRGVIVMVLLFVFLLYRKQR